MKEFKLSLTAIYVYTSTAYMDFNFMRWWVHRFFGLHRWCLLLSTTWFVSSLMFDTGCRLLLFPTSVTDVFVCYWYILSVDDIDCAYYIIQFHSSRLWIVIDNIRDWLFVVWYHLRLVSHRMNGRSKPLVQL